jgi:hypothetical protein
MSEAAAANGEAPRDEPPSGFAAILGGLYFSPGDAFQAIARRPAFWAPLLAYVVLGAAFNAVWLHFIDPAEFARIEIEDSPIAASMSSEDRAQGIAHQARIFPRVAWLGPLVFAPLGVVLVAAVFLFVFRFLYGGEMAFKQSLAVVSWTFLAVAVVALPLTLLVLYLREDWNVDPRTALQSNLSLLLDKGTVPRAFYSLAESLDLFSAWTVALLSIGYGAAAGIRVGRAALGVVAAWAVYVMGKAVLAAFF